VAQTAMKKQASSLAADTDAPAARSWSEEEESFRLWIALARCYLTFSRELSVRVGEYGLTLPQFGVLEALHHLGPLALGELAEKLLVTGGNVTFVMDRLEEQGELTPNEQRHLRRLLKKLGKSVGDPDE